MSWYLKHRTAKIEELRGKTIKKIDETKNKEHLVFITECGKTFKMYHEQECCENVEIEDICGDLENLTGSPITQAEVETKESDNDCGSETWTFYKLATSKGYVTIRWLGESNGYYSEEVDFIEILEVK